MKRVVVTGMGLVTPFGCGKQQNWNSLISAKSSATKITKFDATKYKCQVACEVPIGNGENATFNACLLYTSPSPRDRTRSRMPSSA